MRISDERYSKDWRRYEIALRMIELEARTGTIERWTHLSKYRIQQLFNAYGMPPTRHRGNSPYQPSFFCRSIPVERETSALTAMLLHLELISTTSEPKDSIALPSLARAESLLDCYELYRALIHAPLVNFEHTVLLLDELCRGTNLTVKLCQVCGGLRTRDRMATAHSVCAFCRTLRAEV